MSLREIPRHRWSKFLDDFSRRHLGETCRLEVDSSVAGTDTEASQMPLQGVTLERGHGAVSVQVFVGETTGRHVGHSAIAPSRMWIEETHAGSDRGLRIDADEGSVYLRLTASS